MRYRAYILIRVRQARAETHICKKLLELKGDGWKITEAAAMYGAWDIVAACSFDKLDRLDDLVTRIRTDGDISGWLDATSTMVGTRKNYPFELS